MYFYSKKNGCIDSTRKCNFLTYKVIKKTQLNFVGANFLISKIKT